MRGGQDKSNHNNEATYSKQHGCLLTERNPMDFQPLFGSQWHRQRVASASDWSLFIQGYTPFLLPTYNMSWLMAAKRISLFFQWLRDPFSLITPPQILYFGWPACCEKHINSKYLISAVVPRLNYPESKQNENRPSVGPRITEQLWTGK